MRSPRLPQPPHPASVGFAHVLTYMQPPGRRERLLLSLAAGRRRNIGLREPGWIDHDPPEWDWNMPAIDFTSRAIRGRMQK